MPDIGGIPAYPSTLTGPEIDEALRNIGQVQDAVEQSKSAAQTAEKYGQIVEQNKTAIQSIEDNLDVIQQAPQNAQTAQKAATDAAGSASAAAQSAADAEDAARRAEDAAGMNPDDYYTRPQTNAIVSWLYKATFSVNGWSGSAAPYTQTVTVEAVTGGPAIAKNSTMTSAVMIDDTIQGEARAALVAAASLVDGGTKTFGAGTMTCVLQEDKPEADAEVFFNAMQGGVS